MFTIIYYIFGHTLYVDKHIRHELPLDISCVTNNFDENENENENINENDVIMTSTKTRLYYLGSFLYNAIIMCVISWTIIFAIALFLKTGSKETIINEIFQMIFVSQYFIGLWYFNTPLFYENIIKKNNIRKTFRITSILSFIGVCVITIINVSLTLNNININNKSVTYNYFNTRNYGKIILLIVSRFYSYSSFFANMNLFFVQMYFGKKNINAYSKKTRDYINGSWTLNEKVSSITKEFVKNRNEYDIMIDNLNFFFASLSMFGVIGLYYTMISIFSGDIVSTDTMNTLLFMLTEFMYINTSQNIRKTIKEINDLIKNPLFFDECYNIVNDEKDEIINSNGDNEIKETIINIQEIQIITYKCVREIKNNQLLKGLQETLCTEWNTFQFFGIHIKDTALLQKIFGFLIAYIFTKDIVSVSNFSSFK